MRKIKEVLRLFYEHKKSKRQIARICGISRPAVDSYLSRAQQAGIQWPIPDTITDTQLEQQLFHHQQQHQSRPLLPPDWTTIHQELRRPGVTLMLLWQEYREQQPQGYQYSQFCQHYRQWRGCCDLAMRQIHRAGEKLFVDYAGQTARFTDRKTGQVVGILTTR